MTAVAAPSRHPVLEQQIRDARAAQLDARIAWARSPNATTIEAEKAATRYLNVLLDRLCAALKNTTDGMPAPQPMG